MSIYYKPVYLLWWYFFCSKTCLKPSIYGFSSRRVKHTIKYKFNTDQSTSNIAGMSRGGGGALPYLGVLGMCRWTGCLFELPALAQGVFFKLLELGQGPFLSFQRWAPLSMHFADFSSYYQPNSITFFSLIASKCYKQILKCLKRPWNMKYIGSDYTISRSIKFDGNFQIGKGVFLAARRIETGSGFEHAGGTPLPISKSNTPPPPGYVNYTPSRNVAVNMCKWLDVGQD